MFLMQNFKKFLKKTLGNNENAQGKYANDCSDNENTFQLSEEMANDPSLAFLTGNSWHHTPINPFWKKD
jgi:hypothetical protein